MKNIYSFIWAAICSWGLLKVIKALALNWEPTKVVELFNNGGDKVILLVIVLVILLITHLHRRIGRVLYFAIGFAAIVIVLAIAAPIAWAFLNWLASSI